MFKSKPTRRAGRRQNRRQNKKKNQASQIDKSSPQQLSESLIDHAQNSNNNRSDGNVNHDKVAYHSRHPPVTLQPTQPSQQQTQVSTIYIPGV